VLARRLGRQGGDVDEDIVIDDEIGMLHPNAVQDVVQRQIILKVHHVVDVCATG
jgi:hypothetical protein